MGDQDASVGMLPPMFEPDYVGNAVGPFLLSSQSNGEWPVLPLIDLVLSKENAVSPHFGAVYGVVDGMPYPVCDSAGYASFGFGYRRCAGELLTTAFLKEVLRTVWNGGFEFVRLDVEQPKRIPVGPRTVIDDNIGFQRAENGKTG
ncbi:hypothetical protein [Streptomyces sp. NPDC059460]|uniref:hypothetical protein n=1 Tax=Streptomyces sp. NPDC059460 TaxID=3346840 RepID=UPI0036B2D15E